MNEQEQGGIAPYDDTDWADVVGFPGYVVSSAGRVQRRLKARGKGGSVWKDVKATVEPGKMPRVNLRREGRSVKVAVAALVLLAFKGPPQTEDAVPLFKDGDLSNVCPGNLDWSTGLRHHKGYCKLSVADVRAIRKRAASPDRADVVKVMAREYAVSEDTIRQVVAYRTWKHV